MSDDKKRIDELEQKLIDLHERLDEAKEAKSLAEKAKEAAEAKSKFNWFSKEMLAVYMTMLGGITAWGENLFNRLSNKEAKQQERVQEKKIDTKVGEGIVKYVDYRIGEVTGVCELYLDAVMEAIPPYQRRKVERFIAQAEGGEETPIGGIGYAGGVSSPPEPSEFADDTEVEVTAEPVSSRSVLPASDTSPYQMILQQAQSGEELNLEEVIKKSKRKLQLKDRDGR